MEVFWPVQFLGVIQQGNALIEKKSERQDKGSLVLLPAKGELQVIPCDVFILILKIVLPSRFNNSRTIFGDRNTSPLQDWRRSSWGGHGCLGLYMWSRDKSGSQHWLCNHNVWHQPQHQEGCARSFIPVLNMGACIKAAVVTPL